jgi:magnesium transporter
LAIEPTIAAAKTVGSLWALLLALSELFFAMPEEEARDFFSQLSGDDQFDLIADLPSTQKRSWLQALPPDDIADLIQSFPLADREGILILLDSVTRKEVTALLAYAEDEAGGLMNPRFVRLRPDVQVDVAIRYIRAQSRILKEAIPYMYVLDHEQKLLGVVSFKDLLLAESDHKVSDIMTTDLISLPDTMDQEEVSRVFAQNDLSALPVVDEWGHIKGVVTVDDIVDVVEEEATEDFQKLGAVESIDEPYLQTSITHMLRKRGGWLVILFVSEMLTSTAMSFFEHEMQKAIVLTLFIPLIISSGGNSGSQATTLIIRALALKEVRLRDWIRVFFRELATGFMLGAILGLIGFVRIIFWPTRETLYGQHFGLLAVTIGFAVMGVVLWGSLIGSMLPFMLKKLGLDPASASAPFVATIVDVTGLIIYFTVSKIVLTGTLL